MGAGNGGAGTIQRAAQKPQRCGRFSSPLRKAFSIHRGTLPQSRVRSTAPSEREPGWGAYHSTYRPETATLRAIFIAPTKTQKPVPFTIHRGTLPQSRIRSTAPSEREPGMGAHHSTGYLRNRKGTGDFHRPYETQKTSPGFCRGSDTGWGRALTYRNHLKA